MKSNRTNQQIPMRVLCDSIVQLLKEVDFLKPAAGSVWPFYVLRSSAFVAVWLRAFYIVRKEVA